MFKNISIKRIPVGSALGIAITAALLLIASVILCYTKLPGSTADLFVVVASIAGIFGAGVFSAFGSAGYGWLQGGIAGVLYTLVLFVASLIVCGFSGALHTILTFAVGFVAGAAGGITGININFQKKRK